jgi:hypothetical protein
MIIFPALASCIPSLKSGPLWRRCASDQDQCQHKGNRIAGRAANPVAVNQYGDTVKSCKAIESELSFIDAEVTRLIPASEKTGKNVALGVAGWFLIVP